MKSSGLTYADNKEPIIIKLQLSTVLFVKANKRKEHTISNRAKWVTFHLKKKE